MKKTKIALISTAALAVISTLAFAACTDLTTDVEKPPATDPLILPDGGNTAAAPANSGNGVINPSKDGYVFSYDDYDVVLGSPAEDLLAALGEPQNVFEDESCGFHGIDYTYFYPGVRFNTFSPNEGAPNYILSVVFSDDTVETPEGAYIGMSQEEIEGIYGEPTESGEVRIQYIKDRMSLSFTFDNDVLDDITYYFDAAAEFETVA